MLTLSTLKDILSYDEKTGIFTWKEVSRDFFATEGVYKSWNTRYSGKVAGAERPDGYVKIGVKGKSYLAHRLAWLYFYGDEEMLMCIDHIDHNRSNNKISNLRSVTQQENTRNCSTAKRGASGVIGVNWQPKKCKWKARIKVNYISMTLGMFENKNDAIIARKMAESEFGFHRNHGEI